MEATSNGAAVAHLIYGDPSTVTNEAVTNGIVTNEIATNNAPIGYTSDSSSPTAISRNESIETSKIREETEAEDTDGSLMPIFEPIHPADRQHLYRLATTMSARMSSERPSVGRSRSSYSNSLERKDTLQGVEPGDPVLDPGSDQFDEYKWARMYVRSMDEEGFKRRRAGVVFKNMSVSGSGSALNLQKNVGSVFMAPFRVGEYIHFGKSPEKQILRNFDGIVKSGEMLVVLGRPGSGCSTLLKTMCGELHGLDFNKESTIHYNGIPQDKMLKEFRGEVVYNQEVDKHFPHLTVGQTLEFAAEARTPSHRAHDLSRKEFSQHMAAVVMALFGLSHTYNTKVGNDFVRGVSGGERKRVSIAEMALAGAPIAAWDNSTRGLDAATALKFVKSLRIASNLAQSCQIVAIYQAGQTVYDVFDKAVVLYEGRQIFFGPCDEAEKYFVDMGWKNPPRQTVADFLTSVTNPQERTAREGMDKKVPRTPDEFVKYWKESSNYKRLMEEIEEHEQAFPMDGNLVDEFAESKRYTQAKHTRAKSPYLISVPMQVRLCTKRAYQRIWMDKTSTITTIFGQVGMALIIGSIFYGTPDASAGFFAKGSTLFFAILLNALISISEINSLYEQRPIVEKQASYAFYHPWTEAFGGIVSDVPVKFVIATAFNVILYFLAGLRREPSQFFIFFLFTFISILVMSALFRTLAASTKTISQALALAGVLVLIIVIYTGFVIPRRNMHPWFGWLIWINPVYYAFEAILVNEFHGREFTCSGFYPNYPTLTGNNFICSVAGAVPGERTVSGDAFAFANYEYSYSHVWRNFGILLAMFLFFEVMYLVATELNSATSSSAEFLVFRRGHVPKYMQDLDKKQANDESLEAPAGVSKEESQDDDQVGALDAQTDVFTWRNVKYDIPVKEGHRLLLDSVNGWVKPGTLTALMGTSGAGKTTLLDVLAQRVSFGVITGDMFVNGKPLDQSFQRKTGYVQQQDLHLETTTVREALRFSAMLRQPKTVSKEEKFEFVEEVIKMLSMEDFAEAVVGTPGEGLNVEQRKLLTIGVELAAKPALLIFLDEPTSGLDSQSSWAICAFLRKLADHGQAVLCTIHQPSAILFQEFDRLLFLAKGGKTVYFGEIGEQSKTMLDYFEKNGGHKMEEKANPAEYLLEVGNDPSFVEKWKNSDEFSAVQKELDRIHQESEGKESSGDDDESHAEFAMPFTKQLEFVTVRVFQQYWRTPSYVLGKFILGIASALFISFSFFRPGSTQQGFQDIIFAVFMITTIFTTLVQQIMPRFVTQRALYEVRERPSKAYSWKAFMIANIVVELPYQTLLGVVVWACWYYPVFGANQSGARQGLILLFLIQFFVFASTFAHMVIAALPDAQTAGNIATLMFSMALTFNGVFQPPAALPGFWIFMYRVSPLTYLISGIVSTGLGGSQVQCGASEFSTFPPPAGQTCGAYLNTFLRTAPGYLENPTSTTLCQYCPISSADQFLAGDAIFYGQRWRNFGIVWAYIIFNIAVAVFLYYVFRVKHWSPKSSLSGLSSLGTKVFKRRGQEKVPKEKEDENPAVL